MLVGNNDAETWKGLAVSRTWLIEFCLHCQRNKCLYEVVRFSPYLQLKSTCKELRPKREQQQANWTWRICSFLPQFHSVAFSSSQMSPGSYCNPSIEGLDLHHQFWWQFSWPLVVESTCNHNVELQPLPLLQTMQYTTSNATRTTPVSRGNTGKELNPQYFHLSGYGKHHSRLLSFLLYCQGQTCTCSSPKNLTKKLSWFCSPANYRELELFLHNPKTLNPLQFWHK